MLSFLLPSISQEQKIDPRNVFQTDTFISVSNIDDVAIKQTTWCEAEGE